MFKQANEALPNAWWSAPQEEVLRALRVDPQRGLSGTQIEQMQATYGRNVWEEQGPAGWGELLSESLRSPMIALLLTVAGISLLLRQVREAVVMIFVVLTYIGVELLNKSRTDRTMARLRELQTPRVMVLRDGERQEILLEEVTVGDLLPLQPGSRVAADARLLSAAGLLVNEASLTGESAPQTKDAAADISPDAPLAERPTAVFAGTTVLDGQGLALVTAVGPQSELGRVAGLAAQAVAEPTPLQQEMRDLARTLALVAVIVSALIPLLGWLRGFSPQQMLLTWLSLTFLMVPGQPPIIIAMALALAAFDLARRGVIVRRLQGAETLGSVTTLLSDKTGTLTENRMTLAAIITGEGEVIGRQQEREELWKRFFAYALPAIPAYANDPTDRAVIQAAEEEGAPAPAPGPLVHQVDFGQGRGYRGLEYGADGARRLFVAASPEFLRGHATRHGVGGETRAWSPEAQERFATRVQELAAQGKRIIAYGFREDGADEGAPEGLTLVGAAVLEDPIRPEVRDAVRDLAGAGVRTVMITGDNPATARFVAQEIGLDAGRVHTGSDLDGRADTELEQAFRENAVFARATPEHKLRLVQAAQRLGEVVAVTGDGVNDAPALRTAQIGIAMGVRGTDVAREAADLILTDDNLAHLPDGVAIGRKAYENFRKGITYYLSAKAILLAIFIVPLLLGVPFPLAPIQIIATELLMDLASSTIFVTEEAEPGLMKRKPRRQRRFLSWPVARRILRNMAGPTIAILVVYLLSLSRGQSVESARTAAFATWLLGHIMLALNLKQERTPLLAQGLLSNRFAAGWLVGMIILVLAMTGIPGVQEVLDTTPLTGWQWALVVAAALLASSWLEVLKWVVRTREDGTDAW